MKVPISIPSPLSDTHTHADTRTYTHTHTHTHTYTHTHSHAHTRYSSPLCIDTIYIYMRWGRNEDYVLIFIFLINVFLLHVINVFLYTIVCYCCIQLYCIQQWIRCNTDDRLGATSIPSPHKRALYNNSVLLLYTIEFSRKGPRNSALLLHAINLLLYTIVFYSCIQ